MTPISITITDDVGLRIKLNRNQDLIVLIRKKENVRDNCIKV